MFEHLLGETRQLDIGDNLTLERLVEKLRDFGFNREEADIYLFLLRTGPCPARILSRKFEVNRMKAYRTLKDLEERGVVHRIIGRPMRFVAAPMREILERHVDEVRRKLTDLERGEREIVERWEVLSSGVESTLEEPRFRIFQGRQQVYGLILQMWGRAAREISMLTTANDLTRLSLMGMDDKLEALVRGGAQVRIITQVDEENYGDVEKYLDRILVRNISLPAPIRFVVVDGDETLTTVAMDDSMSITTQDDTGLWTNASSYVKAMKVFFDALWRLAPEARTIIESIKTGMEPQDMRIITTNDEFVETFSNMIKRSEKYVDIVVERIQDLPITTQLLGDHFDNDLRIRLLTRVDTSNLQEIEALSRSVIVMHRSASSDFMLMIVDGREVILHLPRWRATGQAIWSNMKVYVDTMSQVFEDYWREGSPACDIVSKLATLKVKSEILKVVKDAIEKAGCSVVTPGGLVGKSGVEHPFSLVANNPDAPDEPFALDLLPEGEAFGSLIELSVKGADLKPAAICLASMKPLKREEVDLAELYGIKLIQASNAGILAEKVRDEAKKTLKC